MSSGNEDDNEGMDAGELAHKYFMHPEKPGVLLCIPVNDIDTSGMFCYFAEFFPEKDDPEMWNVSFPDLPGCLTCGRGLKQAMANAIGALGGYLNVAKSEGLAIPEPSDIATAIAKAELESEETGVSPDQTPLYLLVPAWPDI